MKNLSIFVIIFWLAAVVGEVMCIVKFFKCDFKESYKAEIVYGLAAVSGFGAIVGYMDFGK